MAKMVNHSLNLLDDKIANFFKLILHIQNIQALTGVFVLSAFVVGTCPLHLIFFPVDFSGNIVATFGVCGMLLCNKENKHAKQW